MVELVDAFCDFWDDIERKVKLAYYNRKLKQAHYNNDKYHINYYRKKIKYINDFYDMLKRITR